MAGKTSSKKEQRRAKLAERNASAEEKLDEEASFTTPEEEDDDDSGVIKGSIKLAERRKASSSSSGKISVSIREVSQEENAADLENAIQLPEQEFYQKMDDELNAVPEIGNVFDGILRNMIRITTQSWNGRFGALPCFRGKNLAWLQLLLVDQQKTAQVKLYALGSRVAMAKDDSDVERSRKLFQDAAPVFMNHYGLWVFSRSLVRKGYSGVLDQDAFDFASYDPLGNLEELPLDPSAGIRCAEIFLFFAVDGDIPGDLCSREAVLEFLEGLNTKKGARKLHGFYVVAGSVVSKTDKLRELKGEHVAAYERDLPST